MYIVDRIIGTTLVCENQETGAMEKFETETEVSEGDVINIVDNKVVIDYELTMKRKARIAEKFNKLKK